MRRFNDYRARKPFSIRRVCVVGVLGYDQLKRSGAATVTASLPQYAIEDVVQHNNTETGIWVTYGTDVYDITEFVDSHPGGDKILLAAGHSIEPFWDLYTVHHKGEVKEILDSMKIGQIVLADRMRLANRSKHDPYEKEPARAPVFRVNSLKPFDGEPLPHSLIKNFVTPNSHFYIRNHLPVPEINIDTYKLEIKIASKPAIVLSMEELRTKFKKHTVMATLQCAGNRRAEMSEHKNVSGSTSGVASISNATWGGARLRDVLLHAGYTEENAEVKHIHFEGLDNDIAKEPYIVSIPIEKAANPLGDVLLAYEMNGKELPKDHGYPLRVIVPGVIGARSVKWLGRILADSDETLSFWQTKDYKSSPPTPHTGCFDFRDAPPIYESPVNSVVCEPEQGEVLQPVNGEISVRGYAFSGGGNSILRVDVSADGGKTWHSADLYAHEQTPYRTWTWTLWEIKLPVLENSDKVQIMCKAIDSFHNVQPDSISGIWNLRGFLNNTWHRVNVSTTSNDNQ